MERSVLIAPPLNAAAVLALRSHTFDTHLDPDDAALYALADFRREPPITIAPERLLPDALDDMNRLRLHGLLVASGRPQEEHAIIGLITASDITRHLHHAKNGDLRVCAAMTAIEDLPLVHYETLESLTAVDLFTMFQGTGLTHALVVEQGALDDVPVARGLLSRKSLELRLQTDLRILHG